MFRALQRWFIKRPPVAVNNAYIALVGAARNPFFYESLKVPDTIDGRFELIVLHIFLLQNRILNLSLVRSQQAESAISPQSGAPLGGQQIEQGAKEKVFARYLSEAFFYDMDASLRELGVADTGVSHRIKKMGKAFHGCLQAYGQSLDDPTSLRAALARNVYGTVVDGDVNALDRLAKYVKAMQAQLADVDTTTILSGNYTWPDAATLGA